MMVITPKHVGDVLVSVLMWILKLFVRQFNCASVGLKNIDIIKMHSTYVEKKFLNLFAYGAKSKKNSFEFLIFASRPS
jgi:hypothetical protein